MPTFVTEIRSFLGLVGYYRHFMPQFAKIAAPLTNLTRKNTPSMWSLREGGAFKELKEVLQHAPILQLADPTRGYIVMTDVNDFAMGVVLSQIWQGGEHPIAYESRKMDAVEMNYPTHEWESLAVIHALCDGVESDRTAPCPAAHWLLKTRRNAMYARQFTVIPQWLPKALPTDQWRW